MTSGSAITPLRYLTKSLVRTAFKCPRKLVYTSNQTKYPRNNNDDSLLQYLSAEGDRFGEYCKRLFPHGIEIGKDDENVGTDSLVEQTHHKLMEGQKFNKRRTLFEGAISHGAFYARPDILDQIINSDGNIELRIIEVKSKSWDSRYTIEEKMWSKKGGILATYLPYIQDIAFQTLVCRLAYPNVHVSSWLMMPDRAKKMKSDLNSNPNDNHDDTWGMIPTVDDTIQSIDESTASSLLNVDELVETALISEVSYPGSKKDLSFTGAVYEWADQLNAHDFGLESFSSPIGIQCSSCEYRVKDPPDNTYSGFDICWQEATGMTTDELQKNPLIVDLHSNTEKQLKQFISEDKYKLSDLCKQDFKLVENTGKEANSGSSISRSQRQWYQVQTIESLSESNDANENLHPSYIIKKNNLKQIMKSWKYPFHFIDFETMSPAIPYYKNMTPYEIFAFQFSHHTLTNNHEGEDKVQHASEFLHTESGSPNIAFLKALHN